MHISRALGLVTIFCTLLTCPAEARVVVDSDYGPDMPSVMKVLFHDHPSILRNALGSMGSPFGVQMYRELLEPLMATRDVCSICKTAVPFVRTQLVGKSWSDLRDTTVHVCVTAVAELKGESFESATLCAGIMDVYGPHLTETRAQVEYVRHIAEQARSKRSTQNDDVIRIAQLADIHVDPEYATGSSTDCGLPTCCRDIYPGTGAAWKYGTPRCNIPQRTLDGILSQVADWQPDFILYTGDNPPHHQWNETYESQIHSSSIVIESFQNILGNVSVFPAFGNHETYPTNLYYTGTDQWEWPQSMTLNEELARLWPEMGPIPDSQLDNIRKGAYYSAPSGVPGLTVIAVNSVFWYQFNFYSIVADGSQAISDMETFIEESLENARNQSEKVILMIHHPMGIADVITAYSQWYSRVVAQYADVIVLHVSGHTHNDHFKVFLNSSGEPVNVQLIAPSVTPKKGDYSMNPSVRVFELDRTTLELRDYHQYRMTLDPSLDEVPQLQLAYSAKSEYNMTDMSPASFASLIDRLDAEPALYDLWYDHYNTNASRSEECNAKCKVTRICDLRSTSYELAYECIERFVEPTFFPETTTMGSSHVRSISGVVWGSAIIAYLATLCLHKPSN